MAKESTDELNNVLENTKPAGIDDYLKEYADSFVDGDHPFSDYMRAKIRGKGITQQELFIRAELPERYGYRLLTQEKNTRQKDYILRLCFAAEFTLDETQRALKLYGMSGLYSKIPRDSVIIICFNQGIYDIPRVNKLLEEHGMEPLKASSSME